MIAEFHHRIRVPPLRVKHDLLSKLSSLALFGFVVDLAPVVVAARGEPDQTTRGVDVERMVDQLAIPPVRDPIPLSGFFTLLAVSKPSANSDCREDGDHAYSCPGS